MILWPVSPSPLDPLPVQSIYAIQNLPWFIALFYAWAVVLAALLFLVKGSTLERLALCLVFTLVFVQFWGLATEWGSSEDSAWFMGHVNYLQGGDRLPSGSHPAFPYFDFPGLPLIGMTLAQATGADVFLTARLFSFLNGQVLTFLLYAVFLRWAGTPRRAALYLVLAIASSTVLGSYGGGGNNQFHAKSLSTIYIAYFMLLLACQARAPLSDYRIRILYLVLVPAAVVSHLFAPVFFAMVLVSGYVVCRATKAPGSPPLLVALLVLVLFLPWQVFATKFNFTAIVGELPRSLRNFVALEWLVYTRGTLEVTVGRELPLWGSLARAFWWLSVFGLGTLLMLWRLRGFSSAGDAARVQLMVFMGTLATVTIGGIGYYNIVHGGFAQYVGIGSLTLAPALVDALSTPKARVVAAAFATAALVLLLPTALTNANTLSVGRIYRYEIAAIEFIARSYSQGEGLRLRGIPAVTPARYIYLPDARAEKGGPYFYATSEAEAWDALERVVGDFRHDSSGASLLMLTLKERVWFQERLHIPLDHQNWRRLEDSLLSQDKVYDNQYLSLLHPASLGATW